ncbi:mitochondrial import inner membrane translocase subunit Tim23 [Lingula anatina]|uniref:Mitochondrial import inner membrane translocase subunit Tim23 n=1 Tax=Lingula anatina TaxID=7574 RepID=A0A1S3KCP1_LINAN|nr:mitochondrial import inner membrane translocase subunit Tim23 [Lingula anatina]|eukprot:XP_013420405.1 mitochondrial import inner membrane translocase subunit Tim23 [Lingula anatina]
MMTDDRRGGQLFGGGLFAPNVPSSPGGPSYPQYFNLDPSYMTPGSEFIVPEGAQQTRGRFELAFLQIGSSVMAGCVLGSIGGVVSNREILRSGEKHLKTTFSNIVFNNGGKWGKKCGVVAFLYSGVGTLFGLARQHLLSQDDDGINTMTAATTTGVLYSLPQALKHSGLKPVAKHLCRGGLVGAVAGVVILGSEYFIGFNTKGRRAWYY